MGQEGEASSVIVKYLGKRYKIKLSKPTTARHLLKAMGKSSLRNVVTSSLVLRTEFETSLAPDDAVHPGWTLRATPKPKTSGRDRRPPTAGGRLAIGGTSASTASSASP